MRHMWDIQSMKKIWDLRSAGPVSEVSVFANDNGKPGIYLRTEPATRYDASKKTAVLLERLY